MFVPPRFIVVDDKPEHLQSIINAFQQLGSPCVGIHFKPAEALDKTLFRGVRGLFLDLHLLEGGLGTDNRRHFSQIAWILEENIHPNGGPFILVIWTENAHLCAELMEYLDSHLDPEKPHARPLIVLPLVKEIFINTGDGSVTAPDRLRDAIGGALRTNPQMAALLGWETDVVTAVGDALAALVGLVPSGERSAAAFPAALDTILSRLAREAVGRANVAEDPRAAINAALAPILIDRILNQEVTTEGADLWRRAVTRYSDRGLEEASSMVAGKINRMLHLAVLGSETIRPTDWGAVVDFPGTEWNDEDLKKIMGATRAELLGDEFKVPSADRERCYPCLVRIGAVCDYAQKRRGPITYLLGLEIPVSVVRDDGSGRSKPPASEWPSPVFMKNGEEPFRLHVNVRFRTARPADACATWSIRYRLREQLLMHLIHHTNVYGSRPGIVQLPVSGSGV